MELHLAIKNILKYQGVDFLLDTKMINALIDFQAYDQHPALKNIFRTLHQDGYVKKVRGAGKWDASCDQMVYEIERDYAFPHDLVELLLKSVAVGLGYKCSVPTQSQPNQSQPNQSQPNPSKPVPTGKPWLKLSVDERETFLNSIVEISPSSCGLKYDSVYLADETYDSMRFHINYEISGVMTKSTSVNFTYAIYDKLNRLRKTEVMTSTFYARKNKNCHIIESIFVSLKCNYKDLSKIVLFFDEFKD